jgi:hypothetical protein
MATKKRKSVHYVDNKKFLQAIIDYRKQLKEAREKGIPEPQFPEYIGECLLKIATGFSTKPSYVNYSFREEMIMDGVENCIKYFEGFDPEYNSGVEGAPPPNPFAYFTTTIYRAFLRRIKEEEEERYALYSNFSETITCDMTELMDDNGNHLMPQGMYDNINQFMKRFEDKQKELKEKRKQAKIGLQKFIDAD